METLGIDAKHQIQIGAVLLGLLALTLFVPRIGRADSSGPRRSLARTVGDLGGGFLLGASLGLVFVPVAGRCSQR